MRSGSAPNAHRSLGLAWLATLALVTACGGAALVPCQGPGGPAGARARGGCLTSSHPGNAVVAAAVAGTAWAVAGGCKLNGCRPPFTCNKQTELCERARCDQGRSCPPAYTCDLDDQRCY